MADDNSQRPFRNTDLQSRATPTASNPPAGHNDPLAELARLIGQSDPFGEFGRSGARQAAVPPVEPAPAPEPHPAMAPHDAFAAADLARQPYGSVPLAGGGEVYHTEAPVPGYEDHAAGMAGYDEAAYDPNLAAPYPGEEQDFYDDIPPPRRRMGVLAIAAVFALAVIGTAGAYGYRALFGSVGSGPPPVIKADSKPMKIVPDKDTQSSKLINDRVNERGGDQKLVSREEQPVDLKDKPAGVLTQDQSMATAGAVPAPGLGSGVIGSDPKKIHTITIRPDQPAGSDAGAAAAPPPQANVADAMPEQAPMQTAPAPAERAAAPAPAPRQPVAHRPAPAPAPQHRVVAASSNAPLSLSPDAPASAPMRTASAPSSRSAPPRLAPSAAAASGSYAVQVSSRRSQADAQAALSRMQSRFAGVLGGQQVMVRRVDLGAKGVYYRAMVGPFGNSDQASKLCSQLKAAGGSCFVQRI